MLSEILLLSPGFGAADSEPVITGVPTISGFVEVGEVLTAQPAPVKARPAAVTTWQWFADGSPISGATSQTYLVDPADEGAVLTVEQTETNDLGTDSAVSAATAAVIVFAGFVAKVDTNLRAGSTTVRLPINAKTGGDRQVRWGDGTVEIANDANPEHTYATNGQYTIQVSGGTTTRLGNTLNAGWQQTVTEVVQWGDLGFTNFQNAFFGCTQNVLLPTDIPAAVTNIAGMFRNAANFNRNISTWNTGNISNFNQTFRSATSFNQPLNDWDVSEVTNFSEMFQGATAFQQDLDQWNTIKGTNFNECFSQSSYNGDITTWNTSEAVFMSGMFRLNTGFNRDISSWNVGKALLMINIFNGASVFNQDISSWNVSTCQGFNAAFNNATAFNQNLGPWQLRLGGVNLSQMLNNCGMSQENYSRTLIGWANYAEDNSDQPPGVTLGATNKTYNGVIYEPGETYTNAVDAKAYLESSDPGPDWTITDGGLAFDTDAAAYITAVETADTEALELGVRVAFDNFVRGCKGDGIWDAIKASCILAGARTLAGALVPLKGTAPTNVDDEFDSGDYNRKTGLEGNGTDKYLDTNRSIDADPQDDYHQAVWVTSGPSTGTARAYIGAGAASTGSTQIVTQSSSPFTIDFRNRNATAQQIGGKTASDVGLIASSRSSATGYSLRVDDTQASVTQTSETPPADNALVFARNSSGSAGIYSDARISFYSIGESLDLGDLKTQVSALMTAIDGAI